MIIIQFEYYSFIDRVNIGMISNAAKEHIESYKMSVSKLFLHIHSQSLYMIITMIMIIIMITTIIIMIITIILTIHSRPSYYNTAQHTKFLC